MKLFHVALLLTTALSLAACGGGDTTPTGDTTPPTVNLTAAPATVTAAGAVGLTAAASDNVGVTGVTFYRGATAISTDTTSPYEASDNVTAADNGALTYRAVASDAAGNTAEATAGVSVNIGAAADTTAPSVVSITPASGATGVDKTANIVVTFSEKMNQAATQAAYQSTDLPAAGVVFSWNAAGTIMTINPNADLTYTAAGKTYAFNLTSTATDLAGNALPPKNSSFKTYKQITTTINSTAALDGYVRSDGLFNTNNILLLIGDSGAVDNSTYRSYLSFDLSGLPAGLTSANILAATLTVRQSSVVGSPYTDLDVGASDLILDHVNYGTSLTATDFDPTVYSNLGDIISSATAANYFKSTLSALKDDLSNNRTRSQYRLRFAKLTDGDGVADIAYLDSGDSATNKPRLEVTYLIP
ncbi:Ig-like domain-containing protein [Deinococcus arenicola]|uniref:Ig-like domain-containing protein n=1 Tax=Deinococcus arenicola TaxID=2994950 RepID=A0ABU4DNW8_9DEIO|nr:Ig-like domain-containing protein [Deinococcus sp. ZS9-10]MDV6374127.1 Ig-like domain-containing protein [Deinococcus sp. ZS9-10]